MYSHSISVQEAEYKALVKAQEAAIAALTEGAPMGGAQTAAIDALKVGSMLYEMFLALMGATQTAAIEALEFVSAVHVNAPVVLLPNVVSLNRTGKTPCLVFASQ